MSLLRVEKRLDKGTRRGRAARAASGTCEADGAGAGVVLAAEHAARAPVEAGGGGVAGVGGGVLAVLAREARGALARGPAQQGVGHARAAVLTAAPLAGVSMLAVLSHEALGTPAWERAESVKTPAAAQTLPGNAVRSGRHQAGKRDAGSLGSGSTSDLTTHAHVLVGVGDR